MTRRPDSVDALVFLQQRRGRRIRRWTPDEIARLESMVGHVLPREMARQLKRTYNQTQQRLKRLGYEYYSDLIAPLGGTVTMAARELGIPTDVMWNLFRRGLIQAAGREGKKDFFIPRAEIERFKLVFQKWQRRRERLIARIPEPTLSKMEAARRINIGATHVERYLQGRVLKGWKVPSRWSIGAPKTIWEWRVSAADTERVKQRRAEGQLSLYTKRYRATIAKNQQRIAELRRSRRLGLSGIEHTRSCPVPGCLSPAQVALACVNQWSPGRKVCEQSVYTAIWNGRLPAQHVQIGRRKFWAIKASDVPKFAAWFARGKRYTGPILAHRSEIAKVHAAGLITITDAVHTFRVTRSCVSSAVQRDHIPLVLRVGEVIGVRRQDVAAYFRLMRLKKRRAAAAKLQAPKRRGWSRERRQRASARQGSVLGWGARAAQPWDTPNGRGNKVIRK